MGGTTGNNTRPGHAGGLPMEGANNAISFGNNSWKDTRTTYGSTLGGNRLDAEKREDDIFANTATTGTVGARAPRVYHGCVDSFLYRLIYAPKPVFHSLSLLYAGGRQESRLKKG
jgi:hypothetical protein